ncbi:MAG: hypothetical protein EBX17_04165 [Betaproteobacteria bacterium]|nr:hypothetical protein [Betaproteobacteria bacterium]
MSISITVQLNGKSLSAQVQATIHACRCTGYQNIVRAVQQAAQAMAQSA